MRPVIMAAVKVAGSAPSGGGGGGGGGGGAATFDPVAGSYNASGFGEVTFAITASKSVRWDWSSSGNLPSSTVPSGGSASQIMFSLIAGRFQKSCTINVTAEGQSWTITMSVDADGSDPGGGVA